MHRNRTLRTRIDIRERVDLSRGFNINSPTVILSFNFGTFFKYTWSLPEVVAVICTIYFLRKEAYFALIRSVLLFYFVLAFRSHLDLER